MAYYAWLLQTADDALARISGRPRRHAPAPAQPPPASSAEGAAEQLEAMLLVEAFGLPEPSSEPIVHRTLLM
ncbi:MAG: hypothetical protein WBV61_06435 [Rhodanobacteraceae bacterium]